MDWHKELERTLGGQGDASLYDPAQYSAQLLQQASRGSPSPSPWGYRPPPQWPQMWMPQHRGAVPQVWGDPAFRSFFPDSGEQPGEPSQPSPHHSEQPVNYRAPAVDMAPSFPIYPRKSPLPSPPEDGRAASEGSPPEARGASQYPPSERSPPEPSRQHFPSPGTEGEAGTPPQYSQYPPSQAAAYPSLQYSPRPEMLDEGPPAEPQDFSCERVREPLPPEPPMQPPLYPATREASSYDIIRNMTEKYGGLTGGGAVGEGAREAVEGFETRRNHLESVLSKMNRPLDAEGMPLPEPGEHQVLGGEHLNKAEEGGGGAQAVVEEAPPVRSRSPQQQKPIKLHRSDQGVLNSRS